MIAQQLSQKQIVRPRALVHGVVSYKPNDCSNDAAQWPAAPCVGDGSALRARQPIATPVSILYEFTH